MPLLRRGREDPGQQRRQQQQRRRLRLLDTVPTEYGLLLTLEPQQGARLEFVPDQHLAAIHPHGHGPASLRDPTLLRGGGSGVRVFGGSDARLGSLVLKHGGSKDTRELFALATIARELQQRGIGKLCVSLGARGAVLLDEANSYHCTAPRVRVLSTVGCGDALLGGLLAADLRGEQLPEMLRLGVICGSATAAHPGTLLFTPEEVEQPDYDLELTALNI